MLRVPLTTSVASEEAPAVHDRPRAEWSYLGRVPYRRALALQHALRDALLTGRGHPTLLLLEHPATVTLGRRAGLADLRLSPDELADRGVDVIRSDRGGQATFHGPGQLVGYPILPLEALRLGPRAYVVQLAEALRAMLAFHGIEAVWREEAPGLWVQEAKIAAFGVHVHHGVTTHGFALNVQPELSAFDLIVPCGRPGALTTSMAVLRGELWLLDALAGELAAAIGRQLGLELRPVAAETVLARAG
jgi:lipoate-protein ligase B